VAAVGSGVDELRPGDRVFVHHHAPCFTCALCARGEYVQCAAWRSGKLVPGGMAEYFAVPAGQYVIQTVRVPRPAPGAGQTFVFATGGGGGAGTVAFSSNVSVSSTNGTPQPALLPTDPTLWTATPIVLGGDDISDLTISLRSGFKVSGRVEFQGSAERPPADRLVQIPVTVEPADGKQKTRSLPGRVDAQGNFTTMGLLPGKYFVRWRRARRLDVQVGGARRH
jgi:hypothetical protein